MASVRSVAAPKQPRHFVRLEHDEVRTITGLTDHASGVVVCARFDAPRWSRVPGDDHLVIPGTPAPGFELRFEVERLKVPYLVDLEPWRLLELFDRFDASLGRVARTMLASAITVPPTIRSLSDHAEFDALIRAAVESQVGALTTFAPYFTIRSLDDPWLTVNLQALRATKSLLPDEDVGAWVRVDRRLVLTGLAAHLAPQYAAVMAPSSSTVVLTVTDMGSEMKNVDMMSAYLRLVRAFADAGLDVIVDGVGEFSPVPSAVGAVGSIAGTRAYRSSALNARHDGSPRNQPKLAYLAPGRLQRIKLSDARRRTASGNLLSCPHVDCRALASDATTTDIRHHNAHLLAIAGEQARRLGPAELSALLGPIRLKTTKAWAQALIDAVSPGELRAEA